MPAAVFPVILSGGSGTRLWPLSREGYPKHLIPLLDEETLLQKTVLRLKGLHTQTPIVVCNHEHRFLVAEQLQQIASKPNAIILEPCGRNTAPAVAIGALHALSQDPDAMLLVLAADHLILQTKAFQQAILAGLPVAEKDKLLTFGVVPTSPHTGYGYIHRGQAIMGGAYQVDEFIEKPNLQTARQYLTAGGYYWNSGMFLFRAKVYLEELSRYLPKAVEFARRAYCEASHDLDFLRLDKRLFSQCPSESIDYAVMEKTDKAAMLPLDATWSDVGSWTSLAEVSEHDDNQNVVIGDVVYENVHNSYLRAESRLLAAIGLDNHVVIETPDAVMVAPKNSAQAVKHIVKQLKSSNRSESLHHRTVYRPWGHHELLIEKPGFQVRRVFVKAGHMIALQQHAERSEHWVVVHGKAAIVCNGVRHLIKENESFYVPKHASHEITNETDQVLEFIEVQLGQCSKPADL